MPNRKPANALAEPTIDTVCDTIKRYYHDAPLDKVREAYDVAAKAHAAQKRASGDPYIHHPVAVAQILAEMKLDLASVMVGLLHDTVEDTAVTLEEIETRFGKDVRELVDGVTKLSKMTFRTSEEKQAENFRKMLVAMAKDIRVILVKLADRLSNMRTLQFLPETKQIQIAQETQDIYAPIANRLGISWMKVELEDLCLKFLHREVYERLAGQVSQTRADREKYIEDVVELLKEKLKDYDVNAVIEGRAKHFYSIYRKMERRSLDYEQIHDVIAFRILVDNITECYKALGVIHALYKPVPGRIKDYIAMPKANSYQSLHTTVIGPNGERIEIQIRTHEMHEIAEKGIAAHWRYKEGKFDSKSNENVGWVNRLIEWQKDLSDPNEFLETVKIDLFAEDVFVFTPKGEVKQLPFGSTPLDFAYAVHTDVGHRCIGAKVNGKIVPLKFRLKSGDTISIITSPTQSPTKDWLKIVKTSRAKAKIRAFIKQQERTRATELGREMLGKALDPFELTLAKVEKSGKISQILEALKCRTSEELFILIGYGRILTDDVLEQLLPKDKIEAVKAKQPAPTAEPLLKRIFRGARKKRDQGAITVADLEDVLIRFGRCCNPLPGEAIVGFITRGRGVTVHAAKCPRALDNDSERRVEVTWNVQTPGAIRHHVRIRVLTQDAPGILATMSQAISALGVNIASANIRTTKDKKAICLFDIEVSDKTMLQRVMTALESKKGVISVERSRA